MNMFVFYLLFSLLDLRVLLELFVLGHVSFVWLFAGYFWDLCVRVLLELFALGHVSCVFTCASWIWLSIPYIRVLFCVYLNLFFDVFYLRQLFYLRDVSVTCVMFLCLLVFTWACPSVSCRLWVFSMGRICISILAQVTHVWLIFAFLVGRHFGLVGIEAFVEGLGLPLTWGMAVLDVLLLLFSMFFYCKPNLHWYPYAFFALFGTCYAIFVHFLRTFCALLMHFLCISYALFMHCLCTFYALFMRFLCALKKRIKSVYTF